MRGQVAVVTGAGSREGIGFAIARRLHSAGLHVAITSTTDRIHDRARELDPSGKAVSALVADLTDEAAARDLVESVLRQHGRIDVLVNNAGLGQTGKPLEDRSLQESSYADWQRQIAITLNTAFLMTRAVLPGMVSRKYGRIVNVSSVTGPLVSSRGSSAYSAAKAGMDGMMRAVALETAADGITINAAAPGWIATGSSSESERAAALHTPIGRAGTADEVAAAVVFLASPDASYITGQSLVIDGGNILQEAKGLERGRPPRSGGSSNVSSRGWWVGADLNCLSLRGGFTVRMEWVHGRPVTSTQDQKVPPRVAFCPRTSTIVRRHCCQIAVNR
jgi:3-oxoacyl-[acyl-carrier protein] reductase